MTLLLLCCVILYHSKSPNDQCGVTVANESSDRPDKREATVMIK